MHPNALPTRLNVATDTASPRRMRERVGASVAGSPWARHNATKLRSSFVAKMQAATVPTSTTLIFHPAFVLPPRTALYAAFQRTAYHGIWHSH